MEQIVIIGGGASGMAAAIKAAEDPSVHVTLLERQARVGRKLLSTGNGRCNLTNTLAAPSHYHGEQPRFCEGVLSRFPVPDTLAWFRGLGLLTVEEYGGRVYPMSQQANSVVDVLRSALEQRGVTVVTGASVEQICADKGGFRILSGDGERRCQKLIVACGGCAGAKLGGVMDGYRLLQSLGHSRTPLHPALTQVRTDPAYPRALKGIRAEAAVAVCRGEQILEQRRGELLFTETGVSGTVIFELSRTVALGGEGLHIQADFFPEQGEEELLTYLSGKRSITPGLSANQILMGTVHNRLGQMLCKYAHIGGDRTVETLAPEELRALACACKRFRLPVTGVSGFESAQVTAGGIRTSEFDPRTLESRLVPGLFACGEVLDVDGDCGGFNLQWAWSSGYVAGRLGR